MRFLARRRIAHAGIIATATHRHRRLHHLARERIGEVDTTACANIQFGVLPNPVLQIMVFIGAVLASAWRVAIYNLVVWTEFCRRGRRAVLYLYLDGIQWWGKPGLLASPELRGLHLNVHTPRSQARGSSGAGCTRFLAVPRAPSWSQIFRPHRSNGSCGTAPCRRPLASSHDKSRNFLR